MSKRGKKKTPSSEEPKPALPKEPGFRPFADALKGVTAPPDPGAKSAQTAKTAQGAAKTPPAPPKKEAPAGPDDAELFRRSVMDVKPLSQKARERVTPAKQAPPSTPPYDEEAEALAKLAALVDGQEPMTWEHTDEHSEWIADDADPGILKRLCDGEFAWQAHLDQHGMTRDQARDALVRFLAGARVQHMRCVLVVHGRGQHSEDSIPVLKPLVQRWLRRAPLKEWVFAYCTARQVDGGAGAMYVLLRK